MNSDTYLEWELRDQREFPTCLNCNHTARWHGDGLGNWGWCLHRDWKGANACDCKEWLSDRRVEQLLTGQEP